MMKKTVFVLCIMFVFILSACSVQQNTVEDSTINADEITFSGDYLIDSVELSEDNDYIETISLSSNNLQELNISEEDILTSVGIYEAEVIWDFDKECIYLDKGYEIGEDEIAFSHSDLYLSQSMDTGEIRFTIADQNWQFQDRKVYNIRCIYADKKFDSYFIYIQNSGMQKVTADDVDFDSVNCAYKDDGLFLAKFDGMYNDNEPNFTLYGNPIAYRNENIGS